MCDCRPGFKCPAHGPPPRCGACNGSGYGRSSLGSLEPDDICEACGGSGVEGG